MHCEGERKGDSGDFQVHGLSNGAHGGAFYCDSAYERSRSGVRVGWSSQGYF